MSGDRIVIVGEQVTAAIVGVAESAHEERRHRLFATFDVGGLVGVVPVVFLESRPCVVCDLQSVGFGHDHIGSYTHTLHIPM